MFVRGCRSVGTDWIVAPRLGWPVGVFLRSPGGEDGSGFILAVCSGNVVFEMAGWTCAKRPRVITAHGYQNADILHESTEFCGSF